MFFDWELERQILGSMSLETLFEEVHKQGSARYGMLWIKANEKVIDIVQKNPVPGKHKVDIVKHKLLLSQITLALLQLTEHPTEEHLKAAKEHAERHRVVKALYQALKKAEQVLAGHADPSSDLIEECQKALCLANYLDDLRRLIPLIKQNQKKS